MRTDREYQARIAEEQDDLADDLLWTECRKKIDAAHAEYLRIQASEIPNTAILLAFQAMQIKTRKANEYYRQTKQAVQDVLDGVGKGIAAD